MGVERRSVVLSELDRVNCAYHEAGHALVAALLPNADPLHKVTIIPRGRAMGVTMQLPEADRHTYTKDYLRNAGRRADGRPGRRRALHEPHDERRVERHRARHRHRAAHGVRVRHVGARPARLSQAGQRLRCRPPARRQRSDGAAGGRGDSQGRDERLRPRAWVIERNTEPMRVLAEALLEQESLEAADVAVLLDQAGVQRN